MKFCRLVEFVINTIPIRGFQDLLLRFHVRKCPRCADRLISREEARLCLYSEGDIAENNGFVQTVAARAARWGSPGAPRRLLWSPLGRWAAAAGLLLTAGAALWLVLDHGEVPVRMISDEGEKFRINYFNVDGAPANPLVIQPRNSDLVIIWAERDMGSPDRKGEPGGRL